MRYSLGLKPPKKGDFCGFFLKENLGNILNNLKLFFMFTWSLISRCQLVCVWFVYEVCGASYVAVAQTINDGRGVIENLPDASRPSTFFNLLSLNRKS